MQLLLVCATPFESAPLRAHFDLPLAPQGSPVEHRSYFGSIVLLHTGLGMTNAAFQLGKYLGSSSPDFALQFGVAGAFPGKAELLEVVEVGEDCFADLGAESPEGYLDLAQMGIPLWEDANGLAIYNNQVNERPALGIWRTVKGLTVNKVTGIASSVAELQEKWAADIESMEGAAFFQVCNQLRLPCRQLRAISNWVEPRNRAGWKMQEAIAKVNEAVIGLIENPEKFNQL